MARLIVLDTGPLGDACRNRNHPDVEQFHLWRITAQANGSIIIVPEIADYELRRELIRCKATDGIRRLDLLLSESPKLRYVPTPTEAMRLAARLWADARNKGFGTADDKALDGDVILVAQAIAYCGVGELDTLTIATYNKEHISRYHSDARHWRAITP